MSINNEQEFVTVMKPKIITYSLSHEASKTQIKITTIKILKARPLKY